MLCLLLLCSLAVATADDGPTWGGPRFKGKRVLVTGGDSGIGLAAVQTFYLECAKVLLVGHSAAKSQAAFEAVRSMDVPAACSGSAPQVAWAAADVSSEADVEAMMQRMVQEFGGLDIAVNNAGTDGNATRQIGEPGFVTPSGRFYDESIWDVNVGGTLKCMNAQIALFKQAGSPGTIINIASIAGEMAWAGPLYTSSKYAMIGFTRQAALQNAHWGIRISAVAPGAVNTSMLRGGLSPTDPKWIARLEALSSAIPAGRVAEPWEMAGPISFLASDMATYANGLILTADGDLTSGMPRSYPDLASSAMPFGNGPTAEGDLAQGGVQSSSDAAASVGGAPNGSKEWGAPRFKGKRVLVTGGDSGIGLAAVRAFYLECAQVLLVGHSKNKSRAARDEIGSLAVPGQCAGSAPSVAWTSADISNASEVSSMMDAALRELGGLDIVVNNAGTTGAEAGANPATQIGAPGFVLPTGALANQEVLDVNLEGTLKCMSAQISHFTSAGRAGVIVNVASICGEVAWCGPLYAASKAAMISFSRQAALHYASRGIRVNVLAPGAVNTTMLRGGRSPSDPVWLQTKKMIEELIPAGRIAEPWEMAGPITFLASDMASYVTGDVLTMDGGLTLASPMPRRPHFDEEAPPSALVV